MSTVKKGVVVRVNKRTDFSHNFEEGQEVIATGKAFGQNSRGYWSTFVDKSGKTQNLLPQHYTIVEAIVKESQATEVVAEDLPSKAVYAVVDSKGEVYASTSDRDDARDLKSILGGKRKGVRIFQYTAVKEIR